ncbi:MAG TPA: ADOP family duplicated permease, partial [Myxococcales bacterium]|nr:ADOP family duplicated permease [Myxococcales bacterium]
DRMWRERFGADPKVIGRSVLVDAGAGTIVGVLPPLRIDAKAGRRFGVGLFPDPDLIQPIKISRAPFLRTDRGVRFLVAVGRLRPGVTASAAQGALRAVLAHVPEAMPAMTGWSVQVTGLQAAVVGESRAPLLLLGAAVALLLLACCANVAGMLLARSSARQRDFAVRAAIGASRGRIALEVLLEALLVGLAGGSLGLLLAVWSLDALVGFGAVELPRLREVQLDLRVAIAGILLSMAAGAASGLWPALHASRADPAPLLQEGGHGAATRASGTARTVLVVLEVALASLLVLSTGLLLRSLSRVLDEPPGARPEGLVVMRFGIGPPLYKDIAANAAFIEKLMARVSALPEVESSSSTSALPLDPGGSFGGIGFEVDERPSPSGVEEQAGIATIMPGFFATMGIPLLRGRDFTSSDRGNSAPVMIVNQAFARRYFPGQDPLSKRVTPHFRRTPESPFLSREIVGVVGDVHQHALDESVPPTLYLPELQDAFPNFFVVVRTAASALRIGPTLRAQVRGIDSTLAITRIYALKDALSSSTQGRRFQLTLLGFFAGTALLLAALGVYGVMAYAVVQRTREFGIRLALGATASDIRRMVLGRTVLLCCAGLALGVLGSAAVSRLLAGALFGVGPFDPMTCAVVALLLLAVAVCAGSLPTRRATRVSPLVALKA